MGYLEGLLGGFTERRLQVESENRREAERAQQREAAILETLAQSPDPEIQSLAISGLLSHTRPLQKRGGLRGWLGEMESNPLMPRIRELIGTPVTSEEPVTSLASRSITGYTGIPATTAGQIGTVPPAVTPAAQPETSPTQGAPLTTVGADLDTGAAPAAAAAAAAPAAAPTGALSIGPLMAGRPTGETRTVSRPRQVLMSPEEQALRTARAKSQGDIEGEVAGLVAAGIPEADARQAVLRKYQRAAGLGGAPFQSIAGQMPDGTPAFGVFDRGSGTYKDPVTGDPLQGFQPRTTTGSTTLGADRESVSRELFGVPASRLSPEQMADVNQTVIDRAAGKAGAVATGRAVAEAGAPLSSQQRFQATDKLRDDWRKATGSRTEMTRQFALMQTGLNRYGADPIGGSQAVLVTFQKILDPTSVVRESEYARSPQGLGVIARLQGMYDRYIGQFDPATGKWIAGGAGVPREELAEMVETARQFMDATAASEATERDRLMRSAQEYGIDPGQIFGGAAPAAGGAGVPEAVGAPPPPPTTRAAPTAAAPTGPTAPARGAGRTARGTAAGPGSDWTMVDGVLHFKGKPYQ